MEYYTAYESSTGCLDAIVKEYLSRGWELYGNPYLGRNGYVQAMIKSKNGEKQTNVSN